MIIIVEFGQLNTHFTQKGNSRVLISFMKPCTCIFNFLQSLPKKAIVSQIIAAAEG